MIIRFVEAEYEYGFERFMQKGMSDAGDDGKFRKINPSVENTIASMKDQTTGIVPALEILQIGYNEMKEHLDETSSSMAATTIASDIFKGLETIGNIFKVDPVIGVQEDGDSCDDTQEPFINTKRRQLRKKAFEGGQTASSGSPKKKKISMKYRSFITDIGEFINIAKAPQVKSKKINQFSEREIKTVIKQLEEPMYVHEREVKLILFYLIPHSFQRRRDGVAI